MLELVGFNDFKDHAGVLEDLTTNSARNIATDYQNHGVPRFRISVSGLDEGDIVGLALAPLIAGADDGLIPAHSSCGVQQAAGLDSCSQYIGYNGRVGQHNGPGAKHLFWRRPELLPNHFPIIQSDAYGHYDLTDGYRGKANVLVMTDSVGPENTVEIGETEESAEWWQIWKHSGHWRYITGADADKSLGDIIIETFN